jgi:hypothetical protein
MSEGQPRQFSGPIDDCAKTNPAADNLKEFFHSETAVTPIAVFGNDFSK